ncbi:helix-turn-helix domain-containing protein [Leptospira ilyithenensis]|uniref:XRE family transcriptional regulator n=1 Tax=Leptospira ilyithenensis TaxID=2484901 RepID=A0A4V3JXH0_9LEPT|nr:helix-turn-helix transcriptional regulator [Leptospira ilyithenensis]TGN11937.1 XRE family transcriptional regulator [Leptospira ilyithenensis]
MNQKNISQNQLAILLDDPPLVSRILRGKAEISKKAAILLNKYLDIEFEVLFQKEIEEVAKREFSGREKSKDFLGKGRKKKELITH